MTAQKKEEVKTGIKDYFKHNATIIIATLALFWQISYQGGGVVFHRVSGFVDSVNLNAARCRQNMDDLATFKQDKNIRDDRQDKDIADLKKITQ